MLANKEIENRNFQRTLGSMIMLETFNINSGFSFLKLMLQSRKSSLYSLWLIGADSIAPLYLYFLQIFISPCKLTKKEREVGYLFSKLLETKGLGNNWINITWLYILKLQNLRCSNIQAFGALAFKIFQYYDFQIWGTQLLLSIVKPYHA